MRIFRINQIRNPLPDVITSSQFVIYHGTSILFSDSIESHGFLKNCDTYSETDILRFCDCIETLSASLSKKSEDIRSTFQNKTRTSFTVDFYRACYYALKRKGGIVNKYLTEIFSELQQNINYEKLKNEFDGIYSQNNKLNNSDCVVYAAIINKQIINCFDKSLHGAIHLNSNLEPSFIEAKVNIDTNTPYKELPLIDEETRDSRLFQLI